MYSDMTLIVNELLQKIPRDVYWAQSVRVWYMKKDLVTVSSTRSNVNNSINHIRHESYFYVSPPMMRQWRNVQLCKPEVLLGARCWYISACEAQWQQSCNFPVSKLMALDSVVFDDHGPHRVAQLHLCSTLPSLSLSCPVSQCLSLLCNQQVSSLHRSALCVIVWVHPRTPVTCGNEAGGSLCPTQAHSSQSLLQLLSGALLFLGLIFGFNTFSSEHKTEVLTIKDRAAASVTNICSSTCAPRIKASTQCYYCETGYFVEGLKCSSQAFARMTEEANLHSISKRASLHPRSEELDCVAYPDSAVYVVLFNAIK